MQSAARIAISAILLTSAIASAYQNTAKLRRDGVLNLYPFPRVGRASKDTWQLPLEGSFLDYKQPEQKRQLYAFPRVGRSELPVSLQQFQGLDSLEQQPRGIPLSALADLVLGGRRHRFNKRGEQSMKVEGNGMWFGPRVGRAYKGNDDEDTAIPQHKNDRSDPEMTEPEPQEDRKKRQTMD